MQKITPFLWFNDQAEEAINLYTSIFKDARSGSITRYGEGMPILEGSVMTAAFQLAGFDLVALNGGPVYNFTPATSFFVTCGTQDEIDALWAKLSGGGMVLMELGQYPFSEKFGWLNDKFGVSWQLNLAGMAQKITPFLMFVGDKSGKAEEALKFYTSLFKDSSIHQVERYGPGQPEPEGNVMHARFSLNGEEFMAMDGGLAHDFTFTPAISFLVNCRTQDEVDYFWEKLTEGGGEPGQCGWLEDKYGVSWQIVPTVLSELMSDPDPEKARRVTEAMLQMKKIDIAGLQQAYNQG